jgi:hypothetical protein
LLPILPTIRFIGLDDSHIPWGDFIPSRKLYIWAIRLTQVTTRCRVFGYGRLPKNSFGI